MRASSPMPSLVGALSEMSLESPPTPSWAEAAADMAGVPTFLPQYPPPPPGLPKIRLHPTIILQGLQAWFSAMSLEFRKLMLMYVFKFDPNSGTAAPALYLQPVSNYKIAAAYDMSDANTRDVFARVVRWDGSTDPPQEPPRLPPPVSSAAPGFCYTDLVTSAQAAKFAKQLGHNPWAPALAAALLEAPGIWSPNRFRLSLGRATADDRSPAYIQGHVEVDPDGLRVRELIPLLSGWVRIGATGDKMVMVTDGQVDQVSAKPTLFNTTFKAPSMQLTLSTYTTLLPNENLNMTVMSPVPLAILLGMYESVRLDAASFNIRVSAGQENNLHCAIVAAGTVLEKGQWAAAPVYKLIDGSDNGAVVSEFALPTLHPFNPEVRAGNFGNKPPQFAFGFNATAGASATVLGKFTLTVAGQATMGAFSVPSAKPKAGVSPEADRVRASLNYPHWVAHESPVAAP